jgi:hypothetical protein
MNCLSVRAAAGQGVPCAAHGVLRRAGHAGVLEAHGPHGGRGAGGQHAGASVQPPQQKRRPNATTTSSSASCHSAEKEETTDLFVPGGSAADFYAVHRTRVSAAYKERLSFSTNTTAAEYERACTLRCTATRPGTATSSTEWGTPRRGTGCGRQGTGRGSGSWEPLNGERRRRILFKKDDMIHRV